MADRRRYTGTKTLQTAWTVLVVVAAVVTVRLGALSQVVTVGVAGGVWLLGLVALGAYDKRAWERLLAASSFERAPASHTADMQQILHGQTVSVTTNVPTPLSQARTEVRANVDGVDASFTVRISDAASTDAEGLTTGDDALDDRFVIEGSAGNVKALLDETVREALLALETPGTLTVTGDTVVYEVPFTRLTAAELDAAGEAVAVLTGRVEEVGGQ